MNYRTRIAIRAIHQPCHHEEHTLHRLRYCEVCEKPWPCKVIEVLDALDVLINQVGAVIDTPEETAESKVERIYSIVGWRTKEGQ